MAKQISDSLCVSFVKECSPAQLVVEKFGYCEKKKKKKK